MTYQYRQIQVKVISSDKVELFLKLPHFRYGKKLGHIKRSTQTFTSIQRTHENLFHRLSCGSGLGINTEILTRFNFKYIEVPYNNTVLRTTLIQFMERSIPSPFRSNRVDAQRILPIEEFYNPEETPETVQDDLFEISNG